MAGAGSDGLVGVGADASVLLGGGGVAWEEVEASVSVEFDCCCFFFLLLKRPRKTRLSWSTASGAVMTVSWLVRADRC